MKYRLQRISTLSLARFGCLLGWIVTVAPSLLCGLVGWRLATILRTWLEGWSNLTLSLIGFEANLDLIEILQLEKFLGTLQTLEGRAVPLLLALVIMTSILCGLLVALTLIVLGWGYNLLAWLTGGVEMELQEAPRAPTTRPQ